MRTTGLEDERVKGYQLLKASIIQNREFRTYNVFHLLSVSRAERNLRRV